MESKNNDLYIIYNLTVDQTKFNLQLNHTSYTNQLFNLHTRIFRLPEFIYLQKRKLPGIFWKNKIHCIKYIIVHVEP